MTPTPQARFWELAEEYLAENDVEEGTIMNNPCLRASCDFLATIHRKSGHLVVKLSAERVQELITDRIGIPFSPAGKVFTEWVAIPSEDLDVWQTVIDEALHINRTRR